MRPLIVMGHENISFERQRFLSIKRDLHQSKETYKNQKKPISSNSDLYKSKDTYIQSKETYINQKHENISFEMQRPKPQIRDFCQSKET